jgi:hypothetical protein
VPRRLVRAPGHDRNLSLGWLAIEWMEQLTLHGRGDATGMAVTHTDEDAGFVVDCYAVDEAGRMRYDSAFYSRPKGTDKSGKGSRFALFEGLGPCRFAGFAVGGEVYEDPWGLGFTYRYEPGEPMGRHIQSPLVRCMATEEGQVGNVYDSIHYNLTQGPLADCPGLDVGLTRTLLPGGGEIRPSTAGSASKDGGLETFAVFDESHLYNLPELRRMYTTVTRNLRKRKGTAGTWFLETTTMFAAGEESIAEATYELAEAIAAGKTKRARALFDHRWGECEDLTDEKALRDALREAFGEAMSWQDEDGLVDEFYDPRNDPVDSRRYWLNAPSSTADAWMTQHEWAARKVADPVEIGPAEPVVLGFDGSRRRTRSITDATALIGCRVSDGHVFEVKVWEQPPNEKDWEVPRSEVDAAVDDAFKRFHVVGLYADPALWETNVAAWEARYGARLVVKASQKHPCEWWMTGASAKKVADAIRAFHDAVLDGDMSHDGAYLLTSHVLNARRRGSGIGKDYKDSPRKIDAAVAAVIAYQARLDAVAAGVQPPKPREAPARITKRRTGGPSAYRR